MIYFYVGLGAAVGGIARFGLSEWLSGRAGTMFPWGTFAVNLLGSLLIGLGIGMLEATSATTETRVFVTVGLLGGFTTFSTYTYETVALLRAGEWLRGTLYSLGSLGLGIVAVLVGLGTAALLLQARS